MVSNKQMLKVLEKGDLDAIHSATLEILGKTGVLVNSAETIGQMEQDKMAGDSLEGHEEAGEGENGRAPKFPPSGAVGDGDQEEHRQPDQGILEELRRGRT